MWWVTTQKNGASALGLQRVLGLKKYGTAWTWLHKLRRAMVRPGRDLLSGRVEVDETFLGGLEEGLRGRQREEKALIVVAAQEDGNGIGRIRMRQIPDASAESLGAFLVDVIQPGTVIHTDGWRGYSGATAQGFVHEVTKLKKYLEPASELLPRVHRVIALLKRWLMGTHQGAVSHKHLDYYLDEFTFRFNRRRSKSRGKLFFRLAQQAVAVDPVPYDLNRSPDLKKAESSTPTYWSYLSQADTPPSSRKYLLCNHSVSQGGLGSGSGGRELTNLAAEKSKTAVGAQKFTRIPGRLCGVLSGQAILIPGLSSV